MSGQSILILLQVPEFPIGIVENIPSMRLEYFLRGIVERIFLAVCIDTSPGEFVTVYLQEGRWQSEPLGN